MKRLYRSTNDVMIAGVCSGLAKYLNVDATIVRLVFVLLLFNFAGGLWIYLAMWMVVPIEPATQADSVEVEAETHSAAPKQVAAPKKASAKSTDVKKSNEENSPE